MPTERRPNLFLVGAQKSGTTTLATLLSCHPQIFFCSPKEPGFLAFGERFLLPPFRTGRLLEQFFLPLATLLRQAWSLLVMCSLNTSSSSL